LKKLLCLAVLAAATVAATPGSARAAAPILQSVKFDNATKVLSVSWSLPPGVQTGVLEANANPTLDSQGYFLYGPNEGNYGPKTIFEVPGSSATSWVHRYPDLPPGLYYLHVGGYDTTCDGCPLREWTNLATFRVTPPPPKVYAPDCTGRPHFKPRSIIVACGDGNLSLLRLSWSEWTSRVATGVGVYHWNDCIPQCYRGHFHSRAGAQVTLYRMNRCRSKGFLQFTRMRVTPPASLPRFKPFTQRLSCNYR
jgi:hypothetical protein